MIRSRMLLATIFSLHAFGGSTLSAAQRVVDVREVATDTLRDVALVGPDAATAAVRARLPWLLRRLLDMAVLTHDQASTLVRDLGIVSTKNLILTSILAWGLDGPAWLRRTLLRHVVTEGAPLERMLADDEVLEQFVRSSVHGVWHAAGSCRIPG